MEDEEDYYDEIIPVPYPVTYLQPPHIDVDDEYYDPIPPLIPYADDSSSDKYNNEE